LRGLLCCLCVVVLATGASAHAVLTKNSLRDAPIKVDTATPVTLTFNTGVEATLSQITLRGETGPERTLPVAAGKEPNQLVVDVPRLTAGAYELHYKVLAADGHVTDSVLRFRVMAAE
jgi:copper resistance protein C